MRRAGFDNCAYSVVSHSPLVARDVTYPATCPHVRTLPSSTIRLTTRLYGLETRRLRSFVRPSLVHSYVRSAFLCLLYLSRDVFGNTSRAWSEGMYVRMHEPVVFCFFVGYNALRTTDINAFHYFISSSAAFLPRTLRGVERN